ncbi:MAG: hypothetical protein ACYC61_27450 [Isosphaeraceae bacterium]
MDGLTRRGTIKLAAIFGSALALWGRSTSAAEGGGSSFTGEWLAGEQPCCILGAGRMLLVVNEKGDIGSALVTGPMNLRVITSSRATAAGTWA